MSRNDSSAGSYVPATFIAIAITLATIAGCGGDRQDQAKNDKGAGDAKLVDQCNVANASTSVSNQVFNRNMSGNVHIRIFGNNTNEYEVNVLDVNTNAIVKNYPTAADKTGVDDLLVPISGTVPGKLTLAVTGPANHDVSLITWTTDVGQGANRKKVMFGIVSDNCAVCNKSKVDIKGVSFVTPVGIMLTERP